jgi:ABC-type branched-subunit amino acid transport system substrate-binding protein
MAHTSSPRSWALPTSRRRRRVGAGTQIVRLKASGADIFFNITTPKFAAQAIKKIADLGWKLCVVSASVGETLKPAGFDNAKGVLTAIYLKDPTDPAWKDDAPYKEWSAFMDNYYPAADKTSFNTVYGSLAAQTLVAVLKQMLLPGIKINQSERFWADQTGGRWSASTARHSNCWAR